MAKSSKIIDFWDAKNLWFFSASTNRIAKDKDAQGFIENKEAAKKGGTVAGVARKELEQQSIRKVSTPENYLSEPEKKKKLEDKGKK